MKNVGFKAKITFLYKFKKSLYRFLKTIKEKIEVSSKKLFFIYFWTFF